MEIILSNIIWMLSGFINGITSFGGNLISIPLLSLFIEPHKVVAIACIGTLAICMTTVIVYRHGVPWKEFLAALAGCCIGAPLGMPMLSAISQKGLLLVVAAIIAAFLAWQWVSPRLGMSGPVIPRWTILPFSIVFGILYTLTGMPGPVLAIYAILRKWEKGAILILLNGLGVLGGIAAAIQHWRSGLWTSDVVSTGCWGLLFAAAGVLLSIPVVKRTDSVRFRKNVLLMLGFSAIVLVIRSFAG